MLYILPPHIFIQAQILLYAALLSLQYLGYCFILLGKEIPRSFFADAKYSTVAMHKYFLASVSF